MEKFSIKKFLISLCTFLVARIFLGIINQYNPISYLVGGLTFALFCWIVAKEEK